jgi:hypothetical protein
MKSAYELAMERLNKQSPTAKLTDRQKKELSELDSRYAAKIAEREIALQSDIEHLLTTGDMEKAEVAQKQLVSQRKSLQAELEDKKDKIRQHGRGK